MDRTCGRKYLQLFWLFSKYLEQEMLQEQWYQMDKYLESNNWIAKELEKNYKVLIYTKKKWTKKNLILTIFND